MQSEKYQVEFYEQIPSSLGLFIIQIKYENAGFSFEHFHVFFSVTLLPSISKSTLVPFGLFLLMRYVRVYVFVLFFFDWIHKTYFTKLFSHEHYKRARGERKKIGSMSMNTKSIPFSSPIPLYYSANVSFAAKPEKTPHTICIVVRILLHWFEIYFVLSSHHIEFGALRERDSKHEKGKMKSQKWKADHEPTECYRAKKSIPAA